MVNVVEDVTRTEALTALDELIARLQDARNRIQTQGELDE